jgi:hypothetical protein
MVGDIYTIGTSIMQPLVSDGLLLAPTGKRSGRQPLFTRLCGERYPPTEEPEI